VTTTADDRSGHPWLRPRASVLRAIVRLGLRRTMVAAPPAARDERAGPGDLVHIDTKKLGRIVGGLGHRATGDRRSRFQRLEEPRCVCASLRLGPWQDFAFLILYYGTMSQCWWGLSGMVQLYETVVGSKMMATFSTNCLGSVQHKALIHGYSVFRVVT